MDQLRADKKRLRARILAARDALDPAIRAVASASITRSVTALSEYKQASSVGAFVSFGSEYDTHAFNAETLRAGKALLLPRVDRTRNSLVFYRVQDPARDLVPGTWGIGEPDPQRCPEADITMADLILVPGVAFSRAGHRIGYGGGFYDRVLATLNSATATIAPAFELQIVVAVPLGPFDRMVDLVVTERNH